MNDHQMSPDPVAGMGGGLPFRWWIQGIAVLSCIAVLPVLGHWLRGGSGSRCAWDGLAVIPEYKVRVLTDAGESISLCCVTCAEFWLQTYADSGETIFVADELTGQEISASQAHYVRSTVVTNAVNGNRIHVFRHREDAEKHAAGFHGILLEEGAEPFPASQGQAAISSGDKELKNDRS